jgi:two-component system OmpR family sensor kinase
MRCSAPLTEVAALRLSIGARWTLRYAVALAISLGLFAAALFAAVSRRINREAYLVTEIHASELLESLRSQTEEHDQAVVLSWLAERIQHTVRESNPDLDLGIQYTDERGEPIASAGSLARETVPIPEDVLRGERPSALRAVNLGSEHAHVISVVTAPGGFLQVAIDTRRYAENIAFVREVIQIALPLTILLTAGAGWLLARGALTPIQRINQAARRISGSNLDESIPTSGSGDELDQLAATLNAMMTRIREGVERMRRFNANAAHELRTPLSRICGHVESILQRPRCDEEYREALQQVLTEIHGLAAGVNAMLRLSQSESGLSRVQRQRVPLGVLLEELVEFFRPLAEDRGIAIELGALAPVAVDGDGSWLRQLFSNLVDNAVKYCERGDRVHIELRQAGDSACVSVADDGPGIPTEELPEIFERFERGARQQGRPGFGLGLPLAREIARAHGGRIEVDSKPGRGATFSVWLPVSEHG